MLFVGLFFFHSFKIFLRIYSLSGPDQGPSKTAVRSSTVRSIPMGETSPKPACRQVSRDQKQLRAVGTAESVVYGDSWGRLRAGGNREQRGQPAVCSPKTCQGVNTPGKGTPCPNFVFRSRVGTMGSFQAGQVRLS